MLWRIYGNTDNAPLAPGWAARGKRAVAHTFAPDEIVEAHRYMESNQQIGKTLVST